MDFKFSGLFFLVLFCYQKALPAWPREVPGPDLFLRLGLRPYQEHLEELYRNGIVTRKGNHIQIQSEGGTSCSLSDMEIWSKEDRKNNRMRLRTLVYKNCQGENFVFEFGYQTFVGASDPFSLTQWQQLQILNLSEIEAFFLKVGEGNLRMEFQRNNPGGLWQGFLGLKTLSGSIIEVGYQEIQDRFSSHRVYHFPNQAFQGGGNFDGYLVARLDHFGNYEAESYWTNLYLEPMTKKDFLKLFTDLFPREWR